jgi:hypothetical protein
MCAKCKLQLGKHLINHQAQPAANTIDASNDSLQFLISQQFFDEDTSQDLIKIQKLISDTCSDEKANSEQTLINAQILFKRLMKFF